MSVDKAVRALHVAVYDDFGTLDTTTQRAIIASLEDLLDKMKLSMQ